KRGSGCSFNTRSIMVIVKIRWRLNTIHFLLGMVFFFLLGCYEKSNTSSDTDFSQLRKDILSLEEQARQLPPEDQLPFWEKQLHNKTYTQTPEAKARIYYRMAGTYYNKGDLDSLKYFMRRAWDVLSVTDSTSEMTVLLNYGEGNIATIEGNIHQENYYFNLASQQMLSDSLLDLTPVQRASIFLATAQSDARLSQYQQALEWNRKAIKALEVPNPPAPLQYRAYRQLANTF